MRQIKRGMIAKEPGSWFYLVHRQGDEASNWISKSGKTSLQDKHNKPTLATCVELGSLYHSLSFMHTPKTSRRRRVYARCNNPLKILQLARWFDDSTTCKFKGGKFWWASYHQWVQIRRIHTHVCRFEHCTSTNGNIIPCRIAWSRLVAQFGRTFKMRCNFD